MNTSHTHIDPLFTSFGRAFLNEELPRVFTFPFYYTPHPLSIEAATILMQELESHKDWNHNFGLIAGQAGLEIGKMFGVLIVKNKEGDIGFLKAFSGKLGNANHHKGFVPPIFDMLNPDGFFIKGEIALNAINASIVNLEQSDELSTAQVTLTDIQEQAQVILTAHKSYMKVNKNKRKEIRTHAQLMMCKNEYENLCEELKNQSLKDQFELKVLQKEWSEKLEIAQAPVHNILNEIQSLKEKRKEQSYVLQQLLFDQYNFLRKDGSQINVRKLFEASPFNNPPSGAGECATPKLLQYAFANGYEPLAMAEFWWGKSPVSEIRKHQQFYPACRGKCEPILGYMLQGIPLEPNPMLQVTSLNNDLEIVFEDEHIVVINKPAEMLSVPGKNINESVLVSLQQRYPNATGPLLVHRLDMSTSGILIAGKTKEVHQNLQAQFIKKTVQKKYIALLDGIIPADSGDISLPLRVDLDNRPHQLVCYEYGKMALTKYEVIERKDGKTKVYFYPITGRTHQLRVHAAHPSGLNTPIVGDDLYGHKADRLHLHAAFLQVKHPVSKEIISFTVDAPF